MKLTNLERLALIGILQTEIQLQEAYAKLNEDKTEIASSIEDRLGFDKGALLEQYRINTDTWEIEEVEVKSDGSETPFDKPENPSN